MDKTYNVSMWWTDGAAGGATYETYYSVMWIKPGLFTIPGGFTELNFMWDRKGEPTVNYYVDKQGVRHDLTEGQLEEAYLIVERALKPTGGGSCDCPPDVASKLSALTNIVATNTGDISTLKGDVVNLSNAVTGISATVTSNTNRIITLENSAGGGGGDDSWPPPHAELVCNSEQTVLYSPNSNPESGLIRIEGFTLEHNHNVLHDTNNRLIMKHGFTGTGYTSYSMYAMVNWNYVNTTVYFTVKAYVKFYGVNGEDVMVPAGEMTHAFIKQSGDYGTKAQSFNGSVPITIPKMLQFEDTAFSKFSFHYTIENTQPNASTSNIQQNIKILKNSRFLYMDWEKPVTKSWYRKAGNFMLGRGYR